MSRAGMARVNGARLYYECKGSGDALMLLHDGLLDSRIWDDQFEVYARRYRAIRYDARGHGRSEVAAGNFSDVNDLLGVMTFLGVDTASVVGSSNGGRVAIDFALEHPGMVDALFCVGPSLSGYDFSEEKRRRISAIFSAAARNPGEGMRAWLEDPHRPPSERNVGARRKVRRLLEERLRDLDTKDRSGHVVLPQPPALGRLSKITVPTLVIVGSRDDADNLAIADLLEKCMNTARKVTIGGAGHMVNMEKPKEFNRIVLSFLDEVLRTSCRERR